MSTLAASGRRIPQSSAPQFVQRLSGALILLLDRFDVARQRRQLLALDDHILKDIGLTRADANLEGNRSFWDLPDSYHTSKSRRGIAANRFANFTGGHNQSGRQRCGA